MSSNGLPFSEDRKEWNEFETSPSRNPRICKLQHSVACWNNDKIESPCSLRSHYWVPYYDGDIICKKCGWILCI